MIGYDGRGSEIWRTGSFEGMSKKSIKFSAGDKIVGLRAKPYNDECLEDFQFVMASPLDKP